MPPIKKIRSEMELTVKERMVLSSIIPKEGDFVTLKVVRKLREALSFSEEEIKKWQFVSEQEDRITFTKWDDSIDQNANINFGEKATDMIVEALKKLDGAKKLTEDHFSLYEKFVEVK